MLKKILLIIFCVLLSSSVLAEEPTSKGIYLNQSSLENLEFLKNIIIKSKEAGVNTFVVDFRYPSEHYQENINLVKQNGIKYVARIVMFPGGGNNSQISSLAYRQKKYKLVEGAINAGADEIQLDYIRFASSEPASKQNAKKVFQVIKWFKDKLAQKQIPLQLDVFGISCFGESLNIGQNLVLFASVVDGLNPMVYPSHYEPYEKYATRPYYAVDSSLKALRKQFNGTIPTAIHPFIEVYNYRHKLSEAGKRDYIAKELAAVKDNNVNGWYAWNIHNDYDNLFFVLKKSTQNNALAKSAPQQNVPLPAQQNH